MNSTTKKIQLLNVNIDNICKEDVISYIVKTIKSNKKATISYVNLHALNISFNDPCFRNFLNESQITFCDGFGIHLASRLTGQKMDFRFTPPDWIDELCSAITQNKWGLFLLGSRQDVAESAATQLRQAHPGLDITTHHGYFDKQGPENEAIINLIDQSNAKILLVGMGMPIQEKWIQDNFSRLSEVQICMPVGALFDFIAKTTPRGPRFLTDHGFEWLTRLFIEPGRLWSRYLIGIPQVLFRILRHHYSYRKDSSN